MRAIVAAKAGDPDVLQPRDLPIPDPGPSQVRLKVAYAGVNFFEVLVRQGRYMLQPEFPFTPGGEVAGIVDAVGGEVRRVKPGQPACALTGTQGAYAEYALAQAEAVIPLPPQLPLKLAAAYPLQGLTAWGVLNIPGQAQPGEWVLVHAAAGGVGGILCQIGRNMGCKVIGTAGGARKCEHAQQLGAEWVIDYQADGFAERVQELTEGHGVNLICDSVGQTTRDGNLQCLADFGRIVLFGYASGPPRYDLDALWTRSAGLRTYSLYHHVRQPLAVRRAVEETLPQVISGKLKLPLGGVFPLEQAAQAHAQLEQRQTVGKLLLAVDEELKPLG